ncbi:hypothetical protein MACJ_003568 [Theileria orientalis]|uniref:Uncharacterized protein n=1 Tax=Theileria orientalis TaxID=68886 RepID=A0A976XJL0_THEOR|nr:hypothetical protein MACJ_003568 [Theileria orientalis]
MIPLDVAEPGGIDISLNKFKGYKLFQRDLTKSNLVTCYMALFSCFLTDLICLYVPLIQYTDLSIVEALNLFVRNQENKISVFYYCNIVHSLVLYSGILLSLFCNNPLVWDILRNWINVGILLTVLALPFNR